jgi:putative ABC transport system ATP-binding protein
VSLCFENVEFSYPKQPSPILKIKELKISAKEKVFLYGPSGSGKSTLLSLITGVLRAQKGKIEILNHKNFNEISDKQRDQIRGEHMGYIFQQFNLLPYLSVRDNIALSAKINHVRLAKLNQNGKNIDSEINRLSEKLEIDSILNQAAYKISVGQQQRVAAARALLGSPEIIIADEPTSSLDEDRKNSFMQLLIQEVESIGAILIFVSHDRSLEKFFHRSISISDFRGAL